MIFSIFYIAYAQTFLSAQVLYSGVLNTGLVWYYNGQKQSDNQMVCYSNVDLNTGLFQSYSNGDLNTRQFVHYFFCLLSNRNPASENWDDLNTGLLKVLYSDPHCICCELAQEKRQTDISYMLLYDLGIYIITCTFDNYRIECKS